MSVSVSRVSRAASELRLATRGMGRAIRGKDIGVPPQPANLRIATVLQRNPATQEVTVDFGGTEMDVPVGSDYYPRVFDRALLLLGGGGAPYGTITAIGAIGGAHGSVRLEKQGSSAIANNTNTFIAFTVASGSLVETTDAEMFDDLIDEETIFARWPGFYLGGWGAAWTGNATGRRISEVVLDDGVTVTQIASFRKNATDTGDMAQGGTFYIYMEAGWGVRLQVFQTSGGPISISQTARFSPLFWMKWVGPGPNLVP